MILFFCCLFLKQALVRHWALPDVQHPFHFQFRTAVQLFTDGFTRTLLDTSMSAVGTSVNNISYCSSVLWSLYIAFPHTCLYFKLKRCNRWLCVPAPLLKVLNPVGYREVCVLMHKPKEAAVQPAQNFSIRLLPSLAPVYMNWMSCKKEAVDAKVTVVKTT